MRTGGVRGNSRRCAASIWTKLFLRLAVLLLAAAAGPSCAQRPVELRRPIALPETFSSQGSAAVPAKWWTAFADDGLDGLVDKALTGNFSILIAWDRLDQAKAVAAKSGAAFRPSADGSADFSRTARESFDTDRQYRTGYSLGMLMSYEVDLWGRVRSTYDAARLDACAGTEDLHAAVMTVAAQIARAWYELVEQLGQLALLDEQIETNEKYLEVITLKFRRGQVSATDVLQQRQLVESTKGERVLVESSVEVLEHQLAVLLGGAPGSLSVEVSEELPDLPALPKTGLPAELVRRRPDVLAAEARVQAAESRLASAIADQFPKLGLAISTDTSAERVRSLFDNWAASVAANLVAPLLDGGLRRAEVERTRAVVSEQLNSYGQVVLTSLQEVADALAQETKQSQYVVSLQKQLELSRQSTDQALENYTKGTTDFTFTRYLTTLLAHQRLQRTHLQSERRLVQFRIDLYRALAGSWVPERPTYGSSQTAKRNSQSSGGWNRTPGSVAEF